MTVDPSAGLYAPIPFIGQVIRPALQNDVAQPSQNGPRPPSPTNSPFAVEVKATPINREGIYVDDVRNVKKARIEPTRTLPRANET
jgi:hypothetical protein